MQNAFVESFMYGQLRSEMLSEFAFTVDPRRDLAGAKLNIKDQTLDAASSEADHR